MVGRPRSSLPDDLGARNASKIPPEVQADLTSIDIRTK